MVRSARAKILVAAVTMTLFQTVLLAQGLQSDPLPAAREHVLRELVDSVPASLPAGALAVLPPEVEDREAVDGWVVSTWATALEESLQRQKPQLRLTDREHLTEILREQKFGDSAYAERATATKVGKLVAARMLLLTRLHEFRLRDARVRVSLEATLVDVETGENLWSRAYTKGIFPLWAKLVIAAFGVLAAYVVWRAWLRARKTKLVKETVPVAKAVVRVDVDGVARAIAAAREGLQRAGHKDAAKAVQQAWVDLDAVFNRVRHALPGGSMDRSRVRELNGAVREAERMRKIIGEVQRECERQDGSPASAESLATRMRRATSELRSAVDAYRRCLR